jgi:hypothetical protein
MVFSYSKRSKEMPKKTKQEDTRWILEETKTADLGDERLNRRLSNVLGMLSRKPAESIPAASRGWDETKAAYRFLDNEAATLEKVLKPHGEATRKRIEKEEVILLVQDTTELDYSSKKQTKGLGKLNYENQLGVHLHTTLAVTPDRVCLGVVQAEVLVREKLGDNRKGKLPIEEKESMRWLNSYRVAQEIAEENANTQVVSIADREGDIYDIFVESEEARGTNKAEWIIRAGQNRRILERDEDNNYKKLFKKVDEAPVVGKIEFNLSRAGDRKARKVKQEIRALAITLKAPRRKEKEFPDIKINVVIAKEINAPVGVRPIEWVILTSLPIGGKKEALQVIEWYLCRWQAEIFFKILKVGCDVEELQLKTIDRIKPCLGLYMIIAWRVLYIMMLGRSCPDIPCSAVFEDEEWQAAYIVVCRSTPPKTPPTLDKMVRMVASLGGFLNRKGDGYPGPQTIWIGIQRNRDFVIAMEAQNAIKRT